MTGTPIQVGDIVSSHHQKLKLTLLSQNDLNEYFSLLDFCNPGYLGSKMDFHKDYENPICKGRDGLATDKEQEVGDAKLKELNEKVSKFMIRRTNDLLSKYRKLLRIHASDDHAHSYSLPSASEIRACCILLAITLST